MSGRRLLSGEFPSNYDSEKIPFFVCTQNRFSGDGDFSHISYTIIHQLQMCYLNFVYVCGSSCLLHTKFSKKNLKNVKCFCLCADFMCFWLCTICLCSCIWIYYCFGCRLCNSRYSHMRIYVCIGCAKTYYKAAKKYGSSIVVCCDGKCIELCASHRIHGNGW